MIDTNPKPWAVIVSVARPGMSIEEQDRKREYLWSIVTRSGIVCKNVGGYFQGNRELGVCVTLDSKADIAFVARIAFENFEQDSVLVLTPERSAYLLHPDGREVQLGKWRSVPKIIALDRDAWTYDPETDTFWVCG